MNVKAAAGRAGESITVRCGRNAPVRDGIRLVVHHDGVALHPSFQRSGNNRGIVFCAVVLSGGFHIILIAGRVVLRRIIDGILRPAGIVRDAGNDRFVRRRLAVGMTGLNHGAVGPACQIKGVGALSARTGGL